MQTPNPNTVILSKRVIIDTFYCRDDFETQEEWDDFLSEVKRSPIFAEDHFYDGLDKEDYRDQTESSKAKVNVKFKYYKKWDTLRTKYLDEHGISAV